MPRSGEIVQTFAKGDAATRRNDAELAMRRWWAHWADAYAYEFKIAAAETPKWRYSSRLPALPVKAEKPARPAPVRPKDLEASANIHPPTDAIATPMERRIRTQASMPLPDLSNQQRCAKRSGRLLPHLQGRRGHESAGEAFLHAYYAAVDGKLGGDFFGDPDKDDDFEIGSVDFAGDFEQFKRQALLAGVSMGACRDSPDYQSWA